jgi:hypothetical protein
VKDLGIDFHYSCLPILIRWREPQYTYFLEKASCCQATRYTSLEGNSDPKVKSKNASMFMGYYNDLQ